LCDDACFIYVLFRAAYEISFGGAAEKAKEKPRSHGEIGAECMVYPTGFEPAAFGVGANRAGFSIGCCHVLQVLKNPYKSMVSSRSSCFFVPSCYTPYLLI
ncbi:MAG: hypothetical protein IJN79_07070, partial [Clostridia bacterium]|nr:hypothetical protein [Clostridia bacterium]